jgi:hypothetical protein
MSVTQPKEIERQLEMSNTIYRAGYAAGREQGWHDAMTEVLKRLDEMRDKDGTPVSCFHRRQAE